MEARVDQQIDQMPLLLSEKPEEKVPQLCRGFAQHITDLTTDSGNNITLFREIERQSNILNTTLRRTFDDFTRRNRQGSGELLITSHSDSARSRSYYDLQHYSR